MAEDQVQAQMRTIGTLPDGTTLYYADPETFGEQESGYKIWNDERKEHVAVALVSLEEINSLRERDYDFAIDLAAVEDAPDRFAEGVLTRAEVAPANGRDFYIVKINPPKRD
jgi:hypothetical protein